MRQIETVRGPVDPSSLGATLMHEHLFIKNPELEENYPNPEWDEAAVLLSARDQLEKLYQKGISTLVDLTVMGLGRSISRIQKLADGLQINIVVATGYYTMKDLPNYFQRHGPGLEIDVPEPLERMFIGDIRHGISGTGVKAGIIKVVTDDPGITPDVERILNAAARAHLETGVPISTHTNATLQTGRLQQEFFKKKGVDLERVIIGHCGDTRDMDYLCELMDKGSVIGLDRFGIETMLPDLDRIETVVELCDRGYADRIVMSHDATFYSVTTEPSHSRQELPNWTHAHISDRILPELRRRGISESTIAQMMVSNPARVLTG